MRSENQQFSQMSNTNLQYEINDAASLEKENPQRALQIYDALFKRLDGAYNGTAWLLHQKGDNKQALPYAQLAAALFPENANYHDTLARIAAELQKFQLAMEHAQLAAQYDADYSQLPAVIQEKKEKFSAK